MPPAQENVSKYPKTLGIIALMAYFLLFTFATMPASTPDAQASVNAHQVPWLRMIIPDIVVSEWAEQSWDRVSLVDRLPIFLGSLALLAAVLLIGRACLRCVKCKELNRLEIVVLSFGVGTLGLTLFAFALGVCGMLKIWWLYLVPISLAGWVEYVAPNGILRDVHAQRFLPCSSERRSLGVWIGFGLIVIIVAGAMLPPWEFDVREYHLQVPKEWFQDGGIHYLPHNTYGAMPLGAELICVIPMAWAQLFTESDAWWDGALIGKTFLAYYALFAALGCWAINARLGNRISATAAAVLLLSCPWVGYISMTGLNEIALGFYLVAAIMAIYWLQRSSDDSWLKIGLVGLLVGAAASVKYTGVVFAVIPIAIWILIQCRARALPAMLIFAVGAAISFSPWLIKNLVHTGNPVFPLLGSLFNSGEQTADQVSQWNNAHQVPESDNLLDSMTELFLTGSRNSPLLMGCLLIAIVVYRQRREFLPYFLILLYGVFVWWFATHHLQRFVVPLLPLFAILAGLGFEVAIRGYAAWRKGLLVGLFLYAVMYLGAGMETDSRLLVRLETIRTGPVLPEQDTTTFRVHRFLNQQLGRDGRVVLVADAEPFDLQMQVDYNSCFDSSIFADWLSDQDPEQQRQLLQEKQVDYVYVSWEELQRYRSSYGYDERVTPDWIQQLVQNGVLIEVSDLEIESQSGQLFRPIPPANLH